MKQLFHVETFGKHLLGAMLDEQACASQCVATTEGGLTSNQSIHRWD